jgi:fructose-bisphosphate aldolase class II
MLVSAKEMLLKARNEGYAVAQININNLEWIKAVLTTVEELKSPVILGVSEGAAKYMGGYENVMAMVSTLDKALKVSVPVAVHLDHGTFEGAYRAMRAGFTSVMFDGSHYPFAENLEKTKQIVAAAHAVGVSVEAEVGSIGGEEYGVVGLGEVADPEECRIISETGVDLFAAGIGNIHGKYPANWPGLRFDVLKTVAEVTGGVPLVLHGGTGIPEDQIKKAISLGIAKINVNTELQLAFAAATREYILAGKDLQSKGFDPRKLLEPGYKAMKEVVKNKLTMFGSVGKA